MHTSIMNSIDKQKCLVTTEKKGSKVTCQIVYYKDNAISY